MVSSSFAPYDLPNVQREIEAWFDSFEVVGLAGRTAATTRSARCSSWPCTTGSGSARWTTAGPVDVDEEMDCVAFGFYLGVQGNDRYVALLRRRTRSTGG